MISEDLSLTQGRLSIIVRSPLFQIELNKMMSKREESLYTIQEDFLDAAEAGVKFHKEILTSKPGTYPTDTKLKSATTMTVLAARLLRPGQPLPQLGTEDEGSYEERLRKVTIEESVKTVTKKEREEDVLDADLTSLLEADYPPSSELESDQDKDVLFGEITDGDDIFNPPIKIEETLARAVGEKG